MIIFFDIETILDESLSRKVLETHKQDMLEEWKEGFDFMPEYHEILTIATWVKTNEGIVTKNLEWNEAEQIQKFFEISEKNILCGFNIKGFDIPFIIKRALRLGIPIPNSLKLFWKKPWDMENMIDLYEVYKHTGYKSWSLDLVCKHIWIPTPKQLIDWSEVQKYHDDSRDPEILEYCKRDVEATILVYEKFKSLNLI